MTLTKDEKSRFSPDGVTEVPVLERFSDRARDYVAHRPDYPDAAIDALVSGLGEPGSLSVVDVGAGTGISARAVADRGCRVIAVEPNKAMRDAAASHPRVTWVEATAERTTLPDACADIVLCAQSFHWMEREQALDEFHRILKPRGRLALLWNIQDHSDPFTREYAEVVKRCAVRSVASPSLTGRREDLAGDRRWEGIRTLEFPHAQSLAEPGLIGRAVSSSYSPKDGPKHDDLVAGLRSLFSRFRHGDRVELRYRTVLHAAERA